MMGGMTVLQCTHPLLNLEFTSIFLFTSVSPQFLSVAVLCYQVNFCVNRLARRMGYGQVHWGESVKSQGRCGVVAPWDVFL